MDFEKFRSGMQDLIQLKLLFLPSHPLLSELCHIKTLTGSLKSLRQIHQIEKKTKPFQSCFYIASPVAQNRPMHSEKSLRDVPLHLNTTLCSR